MSAPSVQSNAIVDSLLEGLAAIGTPPSSWNTAPPATTESAPKDSLEDLPHQLFLQHIDTQVRLGDGVAIPVNEWVLSHNFAVVLYAKDTKAQPGMVELRKLTDDALRALTAVRDQVEAISGLPFAPARLTNRPDFNQAGFRCAVIEFAVDAIWPGTFVESSAVGDLQELFRTSAFRLHSGDADLETWLVTAGATVVMRGSHLQIHTGGIPGAYHCVWKKEEPPRTLYPNAVTTPDGAQQEQVFRFPWRISAHLCVTTIINPSSESFAGIGLGGPANNPEFPFATGLNPGLQLRCRLDTLTWELAAWQGGGDDPTIIALTGVDSLVRAVGTRIRLEWDPIAIEVRAYVNDVLGASLNDPALLPPPLATEFPQQGHIAMNYFFTTGSLSGQTAGQIGPILIDHPNLLNAPAPAP